MGQIVEHINNSESGLSVRTKLNTLIDSNNSFSEKTWIKSNTFPTNILNVRAIGFGAGLFVLFVTNDVEDVILTSPDGITWTERVQPYPGLSWSSIAYGAGLFVAVQSYNGNTGLFLTSPDGITWTTRSFSINFGAQDITYGGGLFVVVGDGGGTQDVLTSSDGLVFTARTTPLSDLPTDHPWSGVAYGNGKYVAVRTDNNEQINSMYSSNGITWTLGGIFGNYVSKVAFGNGIFVGTSGSSIVAISTDGINWSEVGSNTGSGNIIFANGFFMRTDNGTQILTSSDGINWTLEDNVYDGTGGGVIGLVAYGNDRFLAVPTSGYPCYFTLPFVIPSFTDVLNVNSGGAAAAPIVQGGVGFPGLQYLSDYSANYTNRSLMDKASSTSLIDTRKRYSVATASNANYNGSTTGPWGFIKLPVITTNRTYSGPSAVSNPGVKMVIWNQNTAGFTWSPVGTTYKDAAGTTISSFVNSTVYEFLSDGTNWIRI